MNQQIELESHGSDNLCLLWPGDRCSLCRPSKGQSRSNKCLFVKKTTGRDDLWKAGKVNTLCIRRTKGRIRKKAIITGEGRKDMIHPGVVLGSVQAFQRISQGDPKSSPLGRSGSMGTRSTHPQGRSVRRKNCAGHSKTR